MTNLSLAPLIPARALTQLTLYNPFGEIPKIFTLTTPSWPLTVQYLEKLSIKGGAYPRPRMVARVVTTLQLFAAETCNKFLKIEDHDSIVYSKHELILTFLAGATSDFTAGNTTRTAGPTSQIFAADTSFAILYHVTESFA